MGKKPNEVVVEVGRSAVTGRFVTVEEAQRNWRESIVQHIHRPITPPKPTGKR